MWTAVRLFAVCALGVSGLYALRSGLPPRQTPPRVLAVPAAANDVAPNNLITTSGDPPLEVDEVGSKVINVEAIHVEPIRLNPLQAYDEAPAPKTKRVTHYRRQVHHRHWHRKKQHRS